MRITQWWMQPQCAEIVRRIRGDDSQEVFAQLIGVRIPSLSRWENGHTTPSPAYRRMLAAAARNRNIQLEIAA